VKAGPAPTFYRFAPYRFNEGLSKMFEGMWDSQSIQFVIALHSQPAYFEIGLAHGGEGGIRTPDTLSGMPVFKTGAINHSATSPAVVASLPVKPLRNQIFSSYVKRQSPLRRIEIRGRFFVSR
jgi:hypothetical protein